MNLATVPLAEFISWPVTNFTDALLASVIFGLVGILLVAIGFKVFDWLTPGDLQGEIIQKNNISAAILGGAFIIGICIVIAAAIG